MNHKFPFIFLMLCFFTFQASAQDMSRELGIRFSGLENFDFIYKKSMDGMKYKRYRLAATNIRANINEDTQFSFNLAFAAGVEKRKNIANNLKFIHGWEPGIGLSVVAVDDDLLGNINVSLGYVLGFQYDVSDKFYINVEAIPALSVATDFEGEIFAENTIIGAGFNTNSVALTLAYKFSSPKRK